MAEVGELCLWAAAPLALLAAVGSFGGGWTGRGDLVVLGGRAAEATAALLLFGLVGLGDALLAVRLKYAYVASYSGFQQPWPWRLAALWSGPEGGVLVVTFLVAVAAIVSYRIGPSRQAAARTGGLAALVLLGLLTVARAMPFAQLEVPAVSGIGLTLPVRELAWQVGIWATYLTVALAAFAFTGAVGEQLVEARVVERSGRVAASLAAATLTVAVLAAAWRAYSGSGRIFDALGLASVGVHVPAWTLAFSYLHAPGGAAAPAWAVRWCRILSVALFPAALGAGAAMLAGMGAAPPAIPWVGGLAVGIISGAMAGMTRRRVGAREAEQVPGYGSFALLGGLLTLGLAGVTAFWGLVGGPLWLSVAWPLALLSLAAVFAWSISRPALRWRRTWPIGIAAAVLGAAAAYAFSGWRAPGFAVAGGLATGVLAGFVLEMIRLRAARRWKVSSRSGVGAEMTRVLERRASRRWASALGHLGIALLVLGLSADELTVAGTRTLVPGESLELSGGLGDGIRVTYLGFSRYRVGDIDRQVASFTLHRGDSEPKLVTAVTSYDGPTTHQTRTPAIVRGAVRDVIVDVGGRQGREGIRCLLSVRPLAVLVWLGGALLLLSIFARGRAIG